VKAIFDPSEDFEFEVTKGAIWWAKNSLGVPIVQLSIPKGRSVLSPLHIAEEIIRWLNAYGRFNDLMRAAKLKAWLELYWSAQPEHRRVARTSAPDFLRFYERQTLFDFLHKEHQFSYTELMELFRP